MVIHEIFGLSDWACEMADEIAAAGYIGPSGGGSYSFTNMEATIKGAASCP